jgi:hypothetical protein
MFGTAVPHIQSDSPFALEPAPTSHLGDQVRGFGFLHDGSVPSLFSFFRFPLRQFTFPDQAGRSGSQKVRELEGFLLAFPTGLAPVVGQQITIDPRSIDLNPSPAVSRYNLLRARADAGDCDLVVHGIVAGIQRGFLHLGGGAYQSDRHSERLTEGDLASFIRQGGSILTATAVPRGSGERIGIDRDEDSWLDLDETEAGSNPADASSIPCPPAPLDVALEARADSVLVSWPAVTSPLFPITGYNIYRSSTSLDPGTRLNAAPISGTSYEDGGLLPGVYHYRVTALGNSKEGPSSSPLQATIQAPQGRFQRGNCNGNASVDISDAIFFLHYLFTNGADPPCLEACDSNGDLEKDISDAVFVLLFLFTGGRPPGLFPACEETPEACPALAACG